MKKIDCCVLVIFLIISNIFSQELTWKHMNGPLGGIVSSIDINSNGEIFAGVYPFNGVFRGVFKSDDNGESWVKIQTNFNDFEVFSLFITKDDHIWVGTDYQGVLYRSTDNGLTWENKKSGFNSNECWAIGEDKSGILFAGDANFGFLYRSTNKGENWEFVSNNIYPLIFAYDSNNKLYMGTMNGLYYSTNNGLNWLRDNAFPNYYVSSIVIDSNNIIYCATGYSFTNGDGVFYSTDNGNSWTHMGLSNKAILSLAFDSEGKLYAGSKNEGIYVTSDNGQSWNQYDKGLYKKHITKLIINKNDEIFVGSEGGGLGSSVYGGGGVFKSTDLENSFYQVGLPISYVNNIDFLSDNLIISSTLSGVQIYNKNLMKWNNIGLHDVNSIATNKKDMIYAATPEGLFKYNINVNSWELINISFDSVFTIYNLFVISDDSIFIVTNSGLRRTTDGGKNWDILHYLTGTNTRGIVYKNNILINNGFLNNNINLLKSNNMGNSFNSIYSNINSNNRNKPFAFTNDSILYLVLRNSLFSGILKSTDLGESWNEVFQFNNIVNTIYANEYGLIISGTFSYNFDTSKTLLSTDFGNNWNVIQQETSYGISITDINYDGVNKYYLATNGEGIYEIDIITSVKQEEIIAQNFSLSQNYPNPFNPSTEIRYQITEDRKVSLIVYDILGNIVATLLNENQSAGSYNIKFDGSKLSSGVYYYKLIAGDFVSVKKMILLK